VSIPPATGTDGESLLLQRYVQFQAALTADADLTNTPILRDVTLTWPGETRIADVAATFTTGPDKGIYEVLVDDAPLVRAVTGFIEVFQDIRQRDGSIKRLRAATTQELEPRNTGF